MGLATCLNPCFGCSTITIELTGDKNLMDVLCLDVTSLFFESEEYALPYLHVYIVLIGYSSDALFICGIVCENAIRIGIVGDANDRANEKIVVFIF